MRPAEWVAVIVPLVTLAGVIFGAGKISASVSSIDRRLSRIEQWIDTGAWRARPARPARPRRGREDYSD